jgi:hypothetical protein
VSGVPKICRIIFMTVASVENYLFIRYFSRSATHHFLQLYGNPSKRIMT